MVIIVLIFVCLFLGTWILITIITQFSENKITKYLPKFLISFIPKYTFFAPLPGTQDYSLFIRYKTKDDLLSNWKDLNPYQEKRNWYAFLWNPKRRVDKSFFDLTITFLSIYNSFHDKDSNDYRIKLLTSVPYLMVISYISNLPQIPIYNQVQFSLTARTSFNEEVNIEPIFISEFHELD
jgi:hypothetical protein